MFKFTLCNYGKTRLYVQMTFIPLQLCIQVSSFFNATPNSFVCNMAVPHKLVLISQGCSHAGGGLKNVLNLSMLGIANSTSAGCLLLPNSVSASRTLRFVKLSMWPPSHCAHFHPGSHMYSGRSETILWISNSSNSPTSH